MMKLLSRVLCIRRVFKYLCEDFVFLIAGFDEKQLNVVCSSLFHTRVIKHVKMQLGKTPHHDN